VLGKVTQGCAAPVSVTCAYDRSPFPWVAVCALLAQIHEVPADAVVRRARVVEATQGGTKWFSSDDPVAGGCWVHALTFQIAFAWKDQPSRPDIPVGITVIDRRSSRAARSSRTCSRLPSA
jgi:hypothetical protein